MTEINILSILIIMPLLGALFIYLFVRDNDEIGVHNARVMALFATLVTFGMSLGLWINLIRIQRHFSLLRNIPGLRNIICITIWELMAISLFMVLLTTLLLPICILASRESVTRRVREFMISFLLLESFVIGVFCALDGLLFYLFFEGGLIPMFLIIGIWGGDRRVYASL